MRKRSDVIFKKVAIIGVGLIGGSIGLAIKKRKLAGEVVGIGRRNASIKEALWRRAIDIGTKDLKKGTRGADLVILATPVCLIPPIARKIAGNLKKGAILTDVGSTKAEVVKAIERYMPEGVSFVGSHPLAGSEKRGVRFAERDIFKDSVVIMTKTKRTRRSASKLLGRFWKSLGVGRVVIKSPEEHDRIVAEISHLPHLAAAALVNSVGEKSLKFASTGFKDATRIAASDPEIWRDICITNKKQILKALDGYERNLSRLKASIKQKRAEELLREFARSKKVRESLE